MCMDKVITREKFPYFPEGQGNTHIGCFCIFSLSWALRSGIISPEPIATVNWFSEYSRLAESCPTGSNLLMTNHCRPKELSIFYEVAKDLWDHQLQPLTGHHLVARPWHLVPHPVVSLTPSGMVIPQTLCTVHSNEF